MAGISEWAQFDADKGDWGYSGIKSEQSVFKYKHDFAAFTDLNTWSTILHCFTINMSIAHRNLIAQTESACISESI